MKKSPVRTIVAIGIGAALFFVSDCVLFLARYDPLRHRLFKPSFLIMLTYISGEMMIALGMVTIYRAPL